MRERERESDKVNGKINQGNYQEEKKGKLNKEKELK